MTEPLDRQNVLDLLGKLGSEQDAEVLDAARQLHAQVTAAELSWEELLVDDDSAAEPDKESAAESATESAREPRDDSGHTDEDDEAPAETAAEKAEKDGESLALIGKLLARAGISDDFRAELEDYKKDIAAGEFTAADRRYIRALYKRLNKRSG